MREIPSPLGGFRSPFGKWHTAGDSNPFASLMSQLLSGASQLIAHPLEYGSMFQDRAGSIPVTEPGQLVGMVLDHGFTGSKPVAGPELVTNGTFDSDLAGWSTTTFTFNNGAAKSTNLSGSLSQKVGSLTGQPKTFEVRWQQTIISGTRLRPRIRNYADNADVFFTYLGGTQDVKIVVTSPDGGLTLNFLADSTEILEIDNISVRELPGYHATAISDAARGVYREVDGIRYIEYNGVNTAYSTPALPAPLVDKAQVFAGVRKLSDAARGVVLELSPSIATNNGAFALFAPNSAGADFAYESKGTTLQSAIASGIASPATRVMTGLGDISGDTSTLRLNGVQAAQNIGDQGTGNYNPAGTYTLYSGGRAGTSLFTQMHMFDSVMGITRLSAANATTEQIEAAEAYYTARVI